MDIIINQNNFPIMINALCFHIIIIPYKDQGYNIFLGIDNISRLLD